MAEETPDDSLVRALRVARRIEIEDVRLTFTFFQRPPDEASLDEFHTEWFAAVVSCEDGRLTIETGYRLARHVDDDTGDEPSGGSESNPGPEEVLGAAHFLVSYRYETEPSPDDLQSFAQHNAVLNTWPYWREHVQATTASMGLPRLLVPVFRIPLLPGEWDDEPDGA